MLSGGRGLSEVYLALLRVVAEEDGSLRKELRPTKKQRDLEEIARQHLHRTGRNVCRERGRGGGEKGEGGGRRRVGERNIGSGKESRPRRKVAPTHQNSSHANCTTNSVVSHLSVRGLSL